MSDFDLQTSVDEDESLLNGNGVMIERDNQPKSDTTKTDTADNHKWADRVAAQRQQGLEKIGVIAIAVISVVVILLLLS